LGGGNLKEPKPEELNWGLMGSAGLERKCKNKMKQNGEKK